MDHKHRCICETFRWFTQIQFSTNIHKECQMRLSRLFNLASLIWQGLHGHFPSLRLGWACQITPASPSLLWKMSPQLASCRYAQRSHQLFLPSYHTFLQQMECTPTPAPCILGHSLTALNLLYMYVLLQNPQLCSSYLGWADAQWYITCSSFAHDHTKIEPGCAGLGMWVVHTTSLFKLWG